MTLILIIGIVLLGSGVMLLLRGATVSGGGATDKTLDQIEASYGFATRPELAESSGSGSRPLLSLAGRIGRISQNVVGVGEGGIRHQLLQAGMYDTDPLTIVGYRVIAAFAGAVVWLWLAVTSNMAIPILVLGVGAGAAIGWMLPVMVIKRRARQRTEQIDYELPELIDLLVVTLEAGLSFLASLNLAAERLEGPLGTELRLTLQEQRMGLAVNEALEGMLRRGETPALRTFVRSIIQGEALGVSTGMIMRNLALEMRKRRRAAAEERAQKAPVKMLFPLVFLIFPAMFVVLLGPVYYSLSTIFGGQ
jgi:tight adherence protein C